MTPQAEERERASVNRAFSKQSGGYDAEDRRNPVLSDMREQVYRHVARYLTPAASILELNSGTGIDAVHFAQEGHAVYATDLSDGMVAAIRQKISAHKMKDKLCVQQMSYDRLESLSGRKFDFVFSNFGGLNCIDDLARVTLWLPELMPAGALVTWVIMPPVYVWEWLSIFKGNFDAAFRRFGKGGVTAHLEGEHFKTWYHSLSEIKAAFGPDFEFVESEGLCVLSPPPYRPDFPVRHPRMYKLLRRIDARLRGVYPFNRCGDHIIVTFKKR